MSELVQDYFKRDLGDDEFEALGRSLQEDPTAAGRFAELAQADYERFGLPAPLPPRSRAKKALWLWAALGLGAAAAVYQWGGDGGIRVSVAQREEEAFEAVKEAPAPASKRGLTLKVQALGDRSYAMTLQPRPESGQSAVVRDAQGRLVADLGSAEGIWAWDCRRQDGRPAEAGTYEVRVVGDEGTWSQWIQIRRELP